MVNSPGPHERVRVTEPFSLLESLGIDVRLHPAPFHLPSTIRPHSLVIWQRPLPESWRQQMNILRWIRDRGCLLITEWDDHPDLFPLHVQRKLIATDGAALRCCHLIQTSNTRLAEALKKFNPHNVIFENATGLIPQLNLEKHRDSSNPRIFIGNQNRHTEHQKLIDDLKRWCMRDRSIKIVVIQDRPLATALPTEQVEFHATCPYEQYRSVLRSCQIALMPLMKSTSNACKTPIKWIEAAAESVVCVGGPELYASTFNGSQRGVMVNEQTSPVLLAENLWLDVNARCRIATEAHQYVRKHHCMPPAVTYRLWMYKEIWRIRTRIDRKLLERLPQATTNRPFYS